MVQLRIFTGQRHWTVQTLPKFPYIIGRSSSADLRLEEPGVWDRHLEFDWVKGEGITVSVLPGAMATLNGHPFQREFLRNGDVIELGAAKVQFWLSETRQRSYRVRETLAWFGLGLVCAVEIVLIYQLVK